ncbi:CDF family Co(II)/Ni(II) efflux transporter DmeF [Kaistia dalseonensis]|uniref:Cation diffusion facilitator family transporter n=1 Tax=Kaistia dalseonensis TaxID=410840 RepID=A0ABU0HCM7_9HYPH|nr:CDF family Co(II)/Ni(II) efflux transporter DmeF [Kaistia dalseonensis]MCX5497386.1 CDF family Co(II)/Ni(II) efflux transporter DmeF [Kaistia dalseonensis]MDQ0440025.1 cation diffusion facilitator family transporter [Kaistia dalseonensis]
MSGLAQHIPHPDGLAHDHVFLGARHDRNQRRTLIVVAITAATMIIEIVAGYFYGSMALLADGFHMSTHAGALLVAALAYRYARRHAHDPAFSFGTGKIGDLAAFASAVVLGVVALLIAADSLWRFASPVTIHFEQAILIAVIGLFVNLVSVTLLHEGHDHGDHGHAHGHGHGHGHDHGSHDHGHHHHHEARDHNLRAAYLHVAADAMTSVLAIGALVAGRFLGWVWLDPAIGVLGAVLIASWSISLLRESGAILVDAAPGTGLDAAVRARLERGGDHVTDLHLWRVGPGHHAAVISLVTATPAEPAHYKTALSGIHGLSHVTVEVNAARAAP